MFWVIFDTATKRDYYRDVHNLLALPLGGFICYDYRPQHISDHALARADSYADEQDKVLVVYAQPTSYQKGVPSPSSADPLPIETSLWVPTRLASLENVTRRGDRYYFDLKLDKYPTASHDIFSAILSPLHRDAEVPFNKWIAISELDREFIAMGDGAVHRNWTHLVDLLGREPSQFAGDSFWRISEISAGDVDRVQIVPEVESLKSDRVNPSDSRAIYHISELDHLALRIDTRTAQPHDEPEDLPPREIHFATSLDGPLSGFNEKTFTIRRHSQQVVEVEVCGTLRIKSQLVDVRLETSPAPNDYCIGPELMLHFRVGKTRRRVLGGSLLGMFGTIAGLSGVGIIPTHMAVGLALIGFGAVGGVLAYALFTGRFLMPGGS